MEDAGPGNATCERYGGQSQLVIRHMRAEGSVLRIQMNDSHLIEGCLITLGQLRGVATNGELKLETVIRFRESSNDFDFARVEHPGRAQLRRTGTGRMRLRRKRAVIYSSDIGGGGISCRECALGRGATAINKGERCAAGKGSNDAGAMSGRPEREERHGDSVDGDVVMRLGECHRRPWTRC